MSDDLNDLDNAARANLDESGVRDYLRYKQDLMQRGEPIESMREILTGFIWDRSEEVDDPEPRGILGSDS